MKKIFTILLSLTSIYAFSQGSIGAGGQVM